MPIHAQRSYLFNAENRLSSSLINQVLCDDKGFIWIATEDGLNRYDGSKMSVYKHSDQDSTSIANNFVNGIFQDSKGNIYACTHGGVQIYNPYTEAFYPLPKFPNGAEHHSSISEVIELPDGQIWAVGNRHFLLDVQPDKSIIITEIETAREINNTKRNTIDTDGSIWMSRDRAGIFNLKPDGTFRHFFGNSGDPVINCFAVDKNNTLYAGTQGKGLLKYDREKETFVKAHTGNEFDQLPIFSLYCDDNGLVYVGTDNFGLKSFNPATDQILDVRFPIQGDKKAKVHSITKDQDGNMWLGLFQKGVMMLPTEENNFKSIKQNATDISLIGSSYINTVLRDKDGIIWVGTDNDGIYAVSPDFKSSKHYPDGGATVIMSLFEDSKGNLWIGSYGGESGKFDKTTGKITPLQLTDNQGRDSKRVYGYTEDKDGNIWVATMGGGVYKYDPLTNTTYYDESVNPQINPWITCIEYSPKYDCIYLGTYNGVYRIDTQNEVKILKEGLIINDLYLDFEADRMWLATADGIFKVSDRGAVTQKYDASNGLPTNTIYSIENDGKLMWFGSNAGLSSFDPETEEFNNFFVEDGTHGNEFAKKSSFRDKDGTMFFGGVGGVTYFDPQQITSGGHKYDLRINDFYIGDFPIQAGSMSGNRIVTDRPVYETELFCLGPDDNTFSIDFNTKQFMHPTNVQYYYELDGNGWESMPTKIASTSNIAGGNILTFNNLSAGKHTIKIKLVENDIESQPIQIQVDIAPHWYFSWWAKSIYIALLLLLVWLIILNYKHINRARERDAERQHAEEIKETKLQFFTNISHEIRTPLSLVISPLQKLIKSDDDPDRQNTYHIMLRNCHRILRLVNELLDLRKIDNKQLKLHFSKTNIVNFVQDLYDTFKSGAAAKNIDMTFDHQGCDDLEVYIDRSNFDKVIVNLLSNAIKYTPDGGKVNISISQGVDDQCVGMLHEYVQIKVADNGIGIPAEARRHIFDRFYRFENNNQGGTGIGLHLTNQLVMLHNGTITIEDNPDNKGTAFVVRLPLGCKHLNPNDIIDEATLERDAEQLDMTIESSIGFIDAPSKRSPKPKSLKKVWIVEDDAEVQHYLVQNLETEYRITAFNNGAEAWKNIHAEMPDLIITDAMMPEMDGMTLTRKIRQNINLNHIPVLMLTAKIREEDTMEGLDAGVDAYMTKPFNIDLLAKKVENLLESHKRLRNAFTGSQSQEEKIDDIEIASNDDKLMDRVMKVINAHMSDSDITIEMIAEEIGISRVHLHRKLKDITNQSTRDFIRNIRLQQGAKLLREKKLSVAEVSYLVGFKHPNNFSTNFKEMFGMSPSVYSEKYYQGSNNHSSANPQKPETPSQDENKLDAQ